MKTKIFVILAAAALALLVPGFAHAQCPGGDVTLDNTNVTGFDVTVCLTVSGSTVTLDGISDSAGLAVVGLDKLGTTNNVTFVSDTDPSATWADKNNNPNQMDGFGSFYEIDGPASTCGATGNTGCSWTFSGAPGTSGYVVHVRFANGCSAFVGDGTSGSISPDSNCAAVPEPGTLSLLTSGLLGIGGLFFVRRRFPMLSASA